MSGPVRLNFDTNPDDCNLSCGMCEGHSPYSALRRLREQGARPRSRMDPAILRAVFDELRGTCFREAVSSSNGEPLLYAHFEELAALCIRDGILLHVTTNGTFPGGAEHWAALLTRMGADLKISINGATPVTQAAVMPGAPLDAVIQNVRTVAAARDAEAARGGLRSRLTMKVTFMQSNAWELPDLVRLAFELGFDRIRGSHLLSLFPQTDALCLCRNAESRQLFNRCVRRAWRMAETLERKFDRRLELSNFVPLGEQAAIGPCPYLGHEGWIAPDGGFSPCCVPLGARPQTGDLGNVARQGVLAVWNGAPYREFCRTYQDYPQCARCAKCWIGPSVSR